ncbi:hypothetical protein ABIA33_005706 [Streptacidiphilus sp. MAP12-16]|uniref:diacylglycerol kinase family protein n=1 Tax=Streptacidiphilus sp. MAP12-16 TaxID=3156300 RepID=UPI00351120DD
MSAARSAEEALLVVVSPTALALDGESVRVARDVLGAAFAMKAVVPGSLAELERTLSRRGGRRLVVIGDDRALHQVVQLLHKHAALRSGPVGIIPVGKGEKVALARSLGAASRPVDAARAVVNGGERSLDLLVDESGGVVLGGLQIPGRGEPGRSGPERPRGTGPEPPRAGTPADRTEESSAGPQAGAPDGAGRSLRANRAASGRGIQLPLPRSGWSPDWRAQLGRTARTVAAQLRPARTGQTRYYGYSGHLDHQARNAPGQPLRVEADGQLLADWDRPVRLVAVWNAGAPPGPAQPADGLMEILLSGLTTAEGPLRVRARRITVTGGPFTYEADDDLSGPVEQRTWTVEPGAWRLTVPPAA